MLRAFTPAAALLIASRRKRRNAAAHAMQRLKHGEIYFIPASAETSGHLTTGNAKFYAQQVRAFLEAVSQRK